MRTDILHGDVIAGMSSYDELDHEIVDAQQSAYRPARRHVLAGEGDLGCAWSADIGEEFAGHHMQRLRDVAYRPDDDVRRDVLRLLLLDSLVPITVDAADQAGLVRDDDGLDATRMRRVASRPSISGIRMSISTTSGWLGSTRLCSRPQPGLGQLPSLVDRVTAAARPLPPCSSTGSRTATALRAE